MADQPATQPPVVNVHISNVSHATATAEATAVAAAEKTAAPPAPRTRKSTFAAYVHFALGFWGASHRSYLRRRPGPWLVIFWFLFFTAVAADLPFLLLAPLALLVSDAFSIPGWVRRNNAALGTATGHPAPLSAATRAAGALAAPPSPAAPPSSQAPPPAADSHHPERPQDLRTLLLRTAHRGDGKLTVTQAVMETGVSFRKVERKLRRMVRAGYIDMDNEPDSGVIVYLFPELVGRPAPADSPPSSPDPERV